MASSAPSAADPQERGVSAAFRRFGRSLSATLHNRAELLSREFERERVRVARLVVLGVAALFFAALGALTLTLFIIVLFWDSQRLVVIGALSVLYLGLAVGIALFAKGEAARAKRPFAASIEQLRKDREEFSRR